MKFPRRWLLRAVAAALAAPALAHAAPIPVVAAESTYGAIVQAVGGMDVRVLSGVSGAGVDPHDFEPTPATARAVAGARVVVANGLGYDDWMLRLVKANPTPARAVIVAAEVAPERVLPDRNPHIFYDRQVVARVAAAVAQALRRADPVHAAAYDARLQIFDAQLRQIDAQVAALRARRPGLTVAATEPVFGYMLRDLGWKSTGQPFQTAVMNDAEPSPAVVARFEDDLRHRRVALLLFNRQVETPLSRRMQKTAATAGIPTVGVDEIITTGQSYPDWVMTALSALAR